MADFYKNSDYFECGNALGRRSAIPAAEGISYTVVQDLVNEPVTVQDFKQHARIDFNTDDNLIEKYLKAARQYLEGWSQLSFGEKKIRFQALRVPSKWKLMHGPYVSVEPSSHTLFGDILMQGGTELDIELTTGWPDGKVPETVVVAICRYAAGLYAIRENYILSINGVPHEPAEIMDEAQKMLNPIRNVTWP